MVWNMTRGEYEMTVSLRRAGGQSHSQLHRVDFRGKGLMAAGPRRLPLFLQEQGADRGQILGKENGRGKKDKNGQKKGDLSECFQSSHGIHVNQVISGYIFYNISHE